MGAEKESYKKTFWNTAMLYLMAFAKIIFPLITLPYLTRVLSVECYGVVAYIKSIIAYAQMIIEFGFMLSSVKEIVDVNQNKEKIAYIVGDTIFAKGLLSIIALAFVFVLSRTIPILKEHTILLYLSVIPPLISCFLLDFLFRGIEKMHIVSMVFVSMKVISTVLTICTIKSDSDVLLIPIFDIISSLFAVLLTWYIYRKLRYQVHFHGFRGAWEKIKKSFLYFTNGVASSAFGALNTAIIGICISDLQEIAYWSVSIQLIGAVQTMYTPLSNGIYPYMIKSKDLKLIKKVFVIFLPLVLVGTIFAGAISPLLLSIVSGEEYVGATSVFRVLLPILVISFPVAILGWPTLGAIDKIKQINLATISGAIVQVVGLLFLFVVDEFNILNVAIIRNISELTMFLILLVLVRKYRDLFK